MNQKKNNDRSKGHNPSSHEKKDKGQLPGNKEDFNTGSHSPSSIRDVNAGYDDTGMGNNEKASGRNDDDKNVTGGKAKKKTGD